MSYPGYSSIFTNKNNNNDDGDDDGDGVDDDHDNANDNDNDNDNKDFYSAISVGSWGLLNILDFCR